MRGRKPQPVQVQIAKGDPSKRGVHKLDEKLAAQPLAEKGLPKCPTHLKKRARKVWLRWKEALEGMNLDSKPDVEMLEGACVNYAIATEAYIAINKQGLTTTVPIISKKGEHVADRVVANPLIAVHNAAWNNVKKFCSEFGLSPVSRTRLTIEKPDNGEQELATILGAPRAAAREAVQ